MTALDTNILVRFLTEDDQKQHALVLARFEQAEQNGEQFQVTPLVVLELIWVLLSRYTIPRTDVVNAIDELTKMPVLRFSQLTAILQFVRMARESTADLSDLLIAQAAIYDGANDLLTFDKKAARLPQFTLLADDDWVDW